MQEKKVKWTKQQERAISARGSDVLVTASAGTGKTAVLSGRCADIVSDKDICPDVRSLLVLTFTEMAAEEMRARIDEELRKAFLETKEARLGRQLVLLAGADIGTIHSFCRRIIVEHFYELGLDPSFVVIDSDEQRLLKAESLEKTIEWAWGQEYLKQGMRELLYRRDVRGSDGFLGRIIELSDFLEGIVSPEKWYERALVLAEAINPFDTEIGRKQKELVAGKLERILNQLMGCRRLYEKEGGEGDWSKKFEESHIAPVRRCIENLKAGSWENCAESIRSFSKPTTYKPRGFDETKAGLIQRAAKRAMASVSELSELAVVSPEYLGRVSGAVSVQTKVVIELVRKFGSFYRQAKERINCLDFADLEHYAVKLLISGCDEEERPVPTETSLALRKRYKHIFVDEYQDINPVQEAIFEALSSGDNVFVVGDVKQSIYAFRGAEPEIFLEHLRAASADAEEGASGFRVDLNANFRSAKGILDFVNKLFSRIMRPALGRIDYDESSALKPGIEGAGAGKNGLAVELHILDESKEARGDNQCSIRQLQGAMVAERIKRMVGANGGKPEFEIYDRELGKRRPVEYRDIVILMRSPAKRVEDYVQVLRLAQVPVSSPDSGGYLEATEIRDCVVLLKVLDNLQRDIELAALLRSPFFSVSDSELVKIRLQRNRAEKGSFSGCLLEYSQKGRDRGLAEKLKGILSQIERWRRIGRRGNLSELIWRIFRETSFLSFVSALPNGDSRRANLLKLHDRAIQFEGFASNGGVASLRRFVEFLEKIEEAGYEWSSAEPEGEVRNAVRIMSVHKSKGLEFGVVFLAELNSQFNMKELSGDILADGGNTLGIQIIDRQANGRLSSLAHQVIAEEKRLKRLAEEMRILYVAMTRAREKLILTACEKRKKCEEIISNGYFFGDKGPADWQVESSKSPLEWILYGLAGEQRLHDAFETGLSADEGSGDLFSIKLYGNAELGRLDDYILGLKGTGQKWSDSPARKSQGKKPAADLMLKVKESLDWRYGFEAATKLGAKSSVTRLTHLDDEYVKTDYSGALGRQPKAVLSGVPAEVVDSRIVGTATHLVISKLDLTVPVSKAAVEETIERLLTDGAISETVGGHVPVDGIVAFFESGLGRKVLGAEQHWREWPFSFAVPVSMISDLQLAAGGPIDDLLSMEDESIIVQGIIDMVAGKGDEVIIIDFKTDYVSDKEVSERAKAYRRQLGLYALAAAEILRAGRVEKWLYFLRQGREFRVD